MLWYRVFPEIRDDQKTVNKTFTYRESTAENGCGYHKLLLIQVFVVDNENFVFSVALGVLRMPSVFFVEFCFEAISFE